jgi:hypothetical protein
VVFRFWGEIMKNYLSNYLKHISENGNPALFEAINKTVNDIVPKYIANFSYKNMS